MAEADTRQREVVGLDIRMAAAAVAGQGMKTDDRTAAAGADSIVGDAAAAVDGSPWARAHSSASIRSQLTADAVAAESTSADAVVDVVLLS